tara:strand:- start:4252 stop:4719 length:468 start_codon:yes stop_codon:yes gene_type:complete
MSNRGQAQYLRVYTSGGADHKLWQNFYVNSDITLSSKTYNYFPFEWSGVGESSALSGQTVSLKMPATSLAINCFETAFKQQHLCLVSAYEFDTRLGVVSPQSGQTLIAEFLGYVASMNGSFTELTVELGSTLAPIGAQIPSRTATNGLVGVPIQL